MKAKAELLDTDDKVWCASCCIRIAPHEERTKVEGKTYHIRCYDKLHATSSGLKRLGPRRSSTLGN